MPSTPPLPPSTGTLALARAYALAAERHHGQFRKGEKGEPYLEHLVEVAALVAEATGGEDPALVTAAVLHDSVEDTSTTREELAALFGEDVAALVLECTDDKTLPKDERKRRQVTDAPGKSARAKVLKLADKTSNLRALLNSPPRDWPPDRRLGYVRWAREVAAGLKATNRWIEARFDEAADAAERHMRLGDGGGE